MVKWETVHLDSLSNGGMQNGVFYELSRKGSGVPLINVGDMYRRAPITNDGLDLFNATDDELKRFEVHDGDLFFTRSSIVPSGIAFCNWYKKEGKVSAVFDSHVIRFKTDNTKVVPMFLYLQCISPKARKYFMSNAKTATMTTIDQSVLGKCPIDLPPLEEQEIIANALSDMDELIASLEKLIVKKKAIKEGTMQELLTGKKRLPGFCGEWQEYNLGDLCKIVNGGTPSTAIDRYWDGNILWCTPTDVTRCRSKYLYDTHDKITQVGLDASSAQLLPKGTLLLCSRATIGEVRIAGTSICTNQGFKSLIANDKSNNEWLYYMISTLKSRMMEKAIGSTFLEISKKNLSSLSMSVPTVGEQQAIASILSDMDAEIELLEQKLDKCHQTKQGMMQQLLTGKIRLM